MLEIISHNSLSCLDRLRFDHATKQLTKHIYFQNVVNVNYEIAIF